MDEQSGESKKKKWLMKEWMSRKWRNWYQNKVDEKIKGVDSRDKVKRKERSYQWFLKRMISMAEQE